MAETFMESNGRTRTRPSARSPWIDPGCAYKPGRESGGLTLRLDANEGRPFGSSLAELQKALAGLLPESAPGRYAVADALEGKIAERWGVDPARVVVTAGGDDAISRIIAVRTAPGSKVLVFEPAFSMFNQYARARGSLSVELPWWRAGSFPLARAVDLLRNCPALSLVCLASPSNPLGLCVSPQEAFALAEACAANGAAFLFDAAYGEFADEDPSLALASGGAPSYIVRSFSKEYGLAGLRIGYAIAPDAGEASFLRAAGAPYPVSGLAVAAASAALADSNGLAVAVSRVRLEREILTRTLGEFGLAGASDFSESRANFVFFRTKDSQALAEAFARFGIGIRIFPRIRGLEDAVRITCPGGDADFTGLLAAVRGIGEESDE